MASSHEGAALQEEAALEGEQRRQRENAALTGERTQGEEATPAFRAVGFLLSSLGHAVAAKFARRLAPLELEPREFALLRTLSTREGASQQAIGERLGIPPSRMVGLVDGLERRGAIERRPSPRDRRAHALYQTPTGKRLLAKASALAAGLERELTEGLDGAQRARLLELLDHVAEQLGVPPGVHGSQLFR